MVYRRRRQNRGGYRRRRRRGGKIAGYVGMAYKAYKMANYLRGLINVEFKHKDVVFNPPFVIDTIPNIQLLSGMAEGNDENQRNGRSVLCKSNYLCGQLRLAGTATSAIVRMVVFMDKASNGALPGTGDLFENTLTITSPLNTDNAMNRFKVLFDGRYQLDDNKNPQQWVKVFRKQFHHLVYKGATATITDTSTGHLYLCLWASPTPNGGTVTFEFTNRIMFVDN